MGQDQSTPTGKPGSVPPNQPAPAAPQQSPSRHTDPNASAPPSNTTSRAGSPQALPPSSATPQIQIQQPGGGGGFASLVPRAFADDDEVAALWEQLQRVPLYPPLVRTTGAPPAQEIEQIKDSLKESEEEQQKLRQQQQQNQHKDSNSGQTLLATREESPSFLSSPFFAELRRRAISATSSHNPNYSQRLTEINRMQKAASSLAPSPAGSASPVPGALATAGVATTPIGASPTTSMPRASGGGDDVDTEFIDGPLATIPVAPLLQTLGRTQTMCTREISRAMQRCDKVYHDTRQLVAALEGLKGNALQSVRHGQKCYSVEAEVKRLHLELHGDTKGSAAAKAIGHDGPFESLPNLCSDTVELLEAVHALIEPKAREELMKHAKEIRMGSPRAGSTSASAPPPPLSGSYQSKK